MRDYEMIRSKRKTLSIQITRDARLVVRAPMRASKAQIEAFVQANAAWIEKHLQKSEADYAAKRAFSFADGESVYFLGDAHIIRTDAYIKEAQIIDGELLISPCVLQENREQAVTKYLMRQAKLLLPKRVAAFATRLGVAPQAVTITSAKTRWGSCSGKNRISFSFRLMMLPAEQIDYVVVHELAHILEHNHSDRFYAQIAQVLPDYRERQAVLKDFAKRLTF